MLANHPNVLGRHQTASSIGIGDVDGPASSTDNAIARFDGVTGKIIQDSLVTIDDTGHVIGVVGTAGAPSFATASDADTGMYQYALDQIGFASAGSAIFVLKRASANSIFQARQATLLFQDSSDQTFMTLDSAGALSFTPPGTNQGVTLTPNGTGLTRFTGASQSSFIGSVPSAATFGGVFLATPSATPSLTNYVLASNSSSDTIVNAPAGGPLRFTLNGTQALSLDTSGFETLGVNSVAGAATVTRMRKAVTAIADAVATATLTVTVPNAAHSASLRVLVTSSLGAGGAIGANEATGSTSMVFTVARTAGVNAVAGTSAAFGASNANVAGGATITTTLGVSAISGAVGATNTFTVNVTIARGSGASTNHTCLVYAELSNANATGVTIA